jgi:small subunit ribosomal protein S17
MTKEKKGRKTAKAKGTKEKPSPEKKENAEKRRKAEKGMKSIGLDIRPPESTCNDPRCAWHGNLPVRGNAFRGVVTSTKAHGTAVVEWDYHHYFPKYERYERRKSRVIAHNPPCIRAREGDGVVIAECRPLSKTKRFVVVGLAGK